MASWQRIGSDPGGIARRRRRPGGKSWGWPHHGRPDKFGPVIVLQALPGTQGIYGFLTALMIMVRMGVLGGNVASLTTYQGFLFVLAAMPVALVGLVSAIYQGQVAAAGVGVVAKRPEEMGKAVIMAAMVETYAVLSLLASLLLVFSIQV